MSDLRGAPGPGEEVTITLAGVPVGHGIMGTDGRLHASLNAGLRLEDTTVRGVSLAGEVVPLDARQAEELVDRLAQYWPDNPLQLAPELEDVVRARLDLRPDEKLPAITLGEARDRWAAKS